MDWKFIAILFGSIFADVIIFLTASDVTRKPERTKQIFGRKKQYLINPKGVLLILLLGITTACTCLIYKSEKDEKDADNLSHKKELRSRDSLDSIKQVWLDTSLKRQGLKVDYVTGKIVRFLDSSSNTFSDDQVRALFILKNGVDLHREKNGWSATIDITAIGASLANFNYTVGIIPIVDNKKFFIDGFALNHNQTLLQNTSYSTGVSQLNSPLPDNIFIRVKGSFTNITGIKRYYQDRIFRYISADHAVSECQNTLSIEEAKKERSIIKMSNLVRGEKEEWTRIFDTIKRR